MSESFEMTVDEAQAGLRMDVFLAGMVEDATRSFLKKVVQDGRVTVNSHVCKKPSRVMAAGEVVVVDFTNNAASIVKAFAKYRQGTPYAPSEPDQEQCVRLYQEILDVDKTDLSVEEQIH